MTACAVISNVVDLGARAGLAAGDVAGLQDRAADAGDRTAVDHELGHPVAEAQLDQAGVDGRPDPAGERRDHARPGAPDDVEAGHGVAVPGGGVAAALGPADHREEADALLLEPGALLPRGELQVRLGPLARPVVLGAVERRRCRASPAGPAPASRARAAGAAPGSRSGTGRRRTTRPGRRTTPRAPARAGSPACPASASSAVATRPARPAPTTTTSACAFSWRFTSHAADASARRPGGAVPRASESPGGVGSTRAPVGGWRGSGTPAARSSSAPPTTPPPSRRGRRG